VKKIADNRDRPRQRIQTNQLWGWLRLMGEARTRVFIWYALLMIFFVTITIPLVQQRLFFRVDQRVRSELTEKMAEFQALLIAGSTHEDQKMRSQLQNQGREIPKGMPINREQLSSLFEIYMARQLPQDDSFLITILDKQFYNSSPRGLPLILQSNSRLMSHWVNLEQAERGVYNSEDKKVGDVVFIAEPIKANGKTLGVFVVAHLSAGERQEALEALIVLVEVLILAFVAALFLSWMIAGRMLRPLRQLTATAQAISESDLTQRLPVRGDGELAELAATFNEMMNRLESAFASQRNFINDAGHELRTPITIVRGHLELMGNDPEEQQETLALVMDELDRMSRLVEDLMLLAKAERPDFLFLETVNLEVLAQELFNKATALAQRNWRLEATATACVILDRQRVTQAMMNLAQNATQHTTEQDKITLGSETTNGKILLWVKDTGEGIAPDDQQRIFERFARAASRQRRSEGAGLGLAIVRAIAEAHGGQVTLHSQVGTGTTFTIVLPLEPSTENRRQFLKNASNPNR
jgi:signal transduction histidine kinase